MKKVKNRVLPWLIAVSVLALAFLPFFINDMVNAGSDDPTKRYYADACVRRLNVALYPEYELTFHAKKKERGKLRKIQRRLSVKQPYCLRARI